MTRRPDPATLAPGEPPPPPLDHREQAATRIAEAGHNLRLHLLDEPRNLDTLDHFERLIVTRTQGRSFIDATARKADELDRLDREVERANRPEDQIKRVGFEMEEYVAVSPADDRQNLPFHADPGDDDEQADNR